jgi:ATP-dependent exoDNAse (exonuclease V) alpha subunit
MMITSTPRLQLPLKLGWALTVHRAQGMTLSRVELQVGLGRIVASEIEAPNM